MAASEPGRLRRFLARPAPLELLVGTEAYWGTLVRIALVFFSGQALAVAVVVFASAASTDAVRIELFGWVLAASVGLIPTRP